MTLDSWQLVSLAQREGSRESGGGLAIVAQFKFSRPTGKGLPFISVFFLLVRSVLQTRLLFSCVSPSPLGPLRCDGHWGKCLAMGSRFHFDCASLSEGLEGVTTPKIVSKITKLITTCMAPHRAQFLHLLCGQK